MLDTLPDDILYIVFSHLGTAKDTRALALTSKRLRNTIQAGDDGWRIFVRSCFPSISVPPASSSSLTWHQLADSLTWQARAWERRSLSFQAMMPTPPPNQLGARRRKGTPYHPVLDAHFDPASSEELVVWGAGENIIARRRQGMSSDSSPETTVWHRIDGGNVGYKPGYDDITALSVVEDVSGRSGDLGVLVGRDNGHLTLLSAKEGSFGEKLADLHPRNDDGGAAAGWSQETINSVDIVPRKNLVAAAAKSGLFLYNLPEECDEAVAPSSYLDLSAGMSSVSLGQAKWMGEDTMALSLVGSKHALRYAKVTSTGLRDVTTVQNFALEDRFDVTYEGNNLCHGSLTPIDASSVTGGGGSSLLLSAWRDGTVRLQDIRTPSPLDLVYCDNIDPWSSFEALLPFGTSHFVAGGAHGATVKVFDFRWPRQYYHTTALPCGSEPPIPHPRQPFLAAPRDPGPRSTCDHVSGRRCRWHELSRDLFYRPNGTFYFSKSLPRAHARAGVWSLARASPLSPNFYIGISDGVVEADLAVTSSLSSDRLEVEVDPYLDQGFKDRRDMMGAGYTSYNLDASLMETGDGLLNKHNDRNVRMPPMRGKGWSRITEKIGDGVPERLVKRHRLDPRYHILTDFDRADLWKGSEPVTATRECGSWFDDDG